MSEADAEKQLDRIVRIRTSLVMTTVFFGSLVLRLKLTQCSPQITPTMAVDGKHLFWHPPFVASITDAELRGVLVHEVLHCALEHMTRRGDRDHRRWNIACDFAINLIVKEGGYTLPADALLDEQYRGQASEQIYASMPIPPKPPKGGCRMGEQKPKSGSGDQPTDGEGDEESDGGGEGDEEGNGGGQWGEVLDAPAAEAKQIEAEWKIATVEAAQAEKMKQGRLPGNLERLLDEVVRPRVDWRSCLWRFVQRSAKNDYSWRKPSRRYTSGGIIMPSLHSEQMPPIVIAIDTSGSIGGDELKQFLAEVSAIHGWAHPERTYVLSIDAAVNAVDEFGPNDVLDIKLRGGGGTDFRPAFKWVEEQGIEPACMIYLTDTYGTFPSKEPDYPVLWAVTAQKECPFGETVYLLDN
jgi:predicted metal-dependent peptidase